MGLQKAHPDKIIAGGYLEPRPLIYLLPNMTKSVIQGAKAVPYIWASISGLPEKTAVHALFDGEVIIAVNDAGDKEYGGLDST